MLAMISSFVRRDDRPPVFTLSNEFLRFSNSCAEPLCMFVTISSCAEILSNLPWSCAAGVFNSLAGGYCDFFTNAKIRIV